MMKLNIWKILKSDFLKYTNNIIKILLHGIGNKKKKEERKERYGFGIYGIYIDDELVYIGKTNRDFQIRHEEHLKAMEDESNTIWLYRLLRVAKDAGKKIQTRSLLDLSSLNNIKNKNSFSNEELKCMEYALISVLKPRGNTEGTKMEYDFNHS